MDIPKLNNNNCSLFIAEYATGHVLKKDLTIFLAGENEYEVFQVFDNFQCAKEFALTLINDKPYVECAIYSHRGEHLATFDIKGERSDRNS